MDKARKQEIIKRLRSAIFDPISEEISNLLSDVHEICGDFEIMPWFKDGRLILELTLFEEKEEVDLTERIEIFEHFDETSINHPEEYKREVKRVNEAADILENMAKNLRDSIIKPTQQGAALEFAP